MSRIHLSKADIGSVEEEFVIDALRSGWVAPVGPHVDAFEREVADRVGVQDALALSSGTAGLHLALLHFGARPGTVVVVPSMTFAASANAVAYTGATPVFVDSQGSDGNIDPQLLVDAVDILLAEGTTIAAVMVVDLFGRCADHSVIGPAMNARGIKVLEDAAESFGATSATSSAGAFGDAAVLSFNGNKIMTTSGGGMLLSDDTELIEHCRYLATQARQSVAHYEHTEVGYNYRLSNILAALGRGQLTRLDGMVARRRAIRSLYRAALSVIPGVRFLAGEHDEPEQIDNFWLTSIVTDPRQVTLSADSLIKSLNEQDIEARHLWKPMHLQPVFSGERMFGGQVSQSLFEHGVALPSGSILNNGDIERVAEAVHAAVGPPA